MSETLTLDFQYTTSIDKLWSALTDSSKLAKWITENDFKPIVGYRFQFRMPPMNGWNGIIEGEVLIVEAPNRLSYTWESGEKHIVTWTLQDLGNGKVNLHLEQSGISNEQALQGAKWGWTTWSGQLEKLLEQ
ncbi:SRPBCC family protein [Alicyclobacillus acidoterrestris]|uniref:SRPBCC domain-containing protein n=1 Tax=Alicyclobacillus acidoterrestris (strain ATCC 49025 / DSM 3922 / CIP 106132 / NCIMB 13137 / GD3B) TaxID=1356854 RepID=T0CFP7_ALIAG|nr:SRPBCC domain-containing protein [Alicyclobacillus acidoterrestris]EPZ51639.1 ATPase [Alicyclobacillus acidoterrestris ATCC 49025]UNO50477.1 SRPBCC domain-containing protein [Alicyclobacillus acidoterrestris]